MLNILSKCIFVYTQIYTSEYFSKFFVIFPCSIASLRAERQIHPKRGDIMKKTILLILSLCILLTACAGERPQSASTGAPTEASTQRTDDIEYMFDCTAPETCAITRKHYIAMIADGISPGIANYTGYNLECYGGIEDFISEEELSIPCSGESDCRCNEDYFEFLDYYPEEDSAESRIACIEQAIEEGAEVIVLPGYQFAVPLLKLQEEHPDIYFLGIDITDADMTEDYVEYYAPTPNSACVSFATEEAGWLAGYACVKEGYRKLGFASTFHVPQVVNYGYGFLLGADAAACEDGVDIEIRYGYDQHPYCTDPHHQMIRSWCEEGTEVLLECFPESIDYIVNGYGCKTINCDVFDVTLYECLLSAAEKKLGNAVHLLLSSIYNGDWKNYGGKFTELSLADGDFLGLLITEQMKNFTATDYAQVLSEFDSGVRPLPDITSYVEPPVLSEHTTVLWEE